VLFTDPQPPHHCLQNGSINVRARILDNYIEISVEDTGIGVAQEDLEAIFQPYVSVST